MPVSMLNKRELQCSDQMQFFIEKMSKLTKQERANVYVRLELLHLFVRDDSNRMEELIERVK